ncbi:MAG: DUF4276 family protein [Boseongicola sp. SB0662_bin_57]|nr:DUF4276 family protein [Boseongicola sp. SB0662_bin_57]
MAPPAKGRQVRKVVCRAALRKRRDMVRFKSRRHAAPCAPAAVTLQAGLPRPRPPRLFKDKGQCSADELEQAIRAGVEETTGWLGGRLAPYVQWHEFEGLLFSDVSAFKNLPDIPPQAIQALRDIRSAFETPEHINDNRKTAPSKRIEEEVPRYRKRVHGPLIAETAGLETMRAACPRFSAWLACLESMQHRIEP